MGDRRGRVRAGLTTSIAAVAVLAGGLAVAGSGGAAGAAPVTQGLDCSSGPDRQTTISATAPGTIPVGGTFAVEVQFLELGTGHVADGGMEDIGWAVALPSGASLVSGSVSVSGKATVQGADPHHPSATASVIPGGVRVLVPSRVPGANWVTPPALRFRLKATGAAGADIAVRAHPTSALSFFTTRDVTCATTGERPALVTTRVVPAANPSTSSTAPAGTTPTTSTTTTLPPVTSTETVTYGAGECGRSIPVAVPEHAVSAQATLVGSAGGSGGAAPGGVGGAGGAGARVTASLSVTAGASWTAIVGCKPTGASTANPTDYGSGFGWGGFGGASHNAMNPELPHRAAHGGGASAICRHGSCDPSAPQQGEADVPVVVAGGGGGGGASRCASTPGGAGGDAGTGTVTSHGGGSGPSGAPGGNGSATSGTAGTGGAAGVTSAGLKRSADNGQDSSSGGIGSGGGGGGGGYRGAGGGTAGEIGALEQPCTSGGGGGGGSSWAQAGLTGVTFASTTTPASVTIVFTLRTPATPPVDVAPFASAEDLVDQTYVDLLDRVPTPTELQQRSDAIDAGSLTPENLVISLLSTDSRAPDAQVIRLYLAYFGRPPETGGLTYWLGQMAAGTSIHTASNQFAGLKEFRDMYGPLSNLEFVKLVYRNVLGREGEPDGVAYWTAELDAGKITRGKVMTQFSEAVENRTAKTTHVGLVRIYREMLGNTPNRTYVNAALAGASGTQAVWQFVVDDIRHSHGYALRIDAAR